MKKRLLRFTNVLLLPLLFLLLMAVSMNGRADDTTSGSSVTATISIDKLDYAPGDKVYITGKGWTAGEEVILQVFNETFPSYSSTDSRYLDWSVFADADGNFTSAWPVEDPDLNTSLVLTADGQTSGFKYQVFFTDAADADDGDGTMTVDVTSICTGLTGKTFVFTFTNNQTSPSQDFKNNSQITLTIPTGWTVPTISNVTLTTVTGTSVSLGTISGMVIPVNITNPNGLPSGKTFTIKYSNITIPGSGSYSFTTKSKSKPGTLTELTIGSPTIVVNDLPVGSASPQTICSGTDSRVDLSSSISGTTFAWTAAQQSGATITGFGSGSGTTIAQTLTNTGNILFQELYAIL